jgi:hypothetical protein
VTDENLSLLVDVSAPIAKSWSTHGRVFSVDYSELIKCPQLSKESMVYKIKRVKTCDGSAVEDGEISDEQVYFNYKFQCMSSSPYSLMVEFPDDSLTPDGTYEFTVNAKIDSDGDKVADIGENPVVKQIFLTTVGCPVERNPTSFKIAAANFPALGLGESRLVQETNWRFYSSIKFGVFLACVFFAIGFAASTASRGVLLRSNIKNEQESEQYIPIGASGRASYGSVL